MKPSPRFTRHLAAALLALALLAPLAGRAQLYRAGDIVQPFTLVNRATGQPLTRDDLTGRIIFMEWFAWWCPFCQIASSTVVPALHTAYPDGTPAGLQVLHVGVNLQGGAEAQTANFLNNADFDLVLNDFTRALANRFQSGGQPIFAIINGVAGSPSHDQWELLLHQDGFGERDFSDALQLFKAAIESVQAPPPRLEHLARDADGVPELTLTPLPGQVARIEVSTDLEVWELLADNLTGTGQPIVVRDPTLRPEGRAYYRSSVRPAAAQ